MRNRMDIGTSEPTRYEVIVEHNGAVTILGYTARTGRYGLQRIVGTHADRIIGMVNDDDAPVSIRGGGTQCRITFGDSVVVRFSGRTEREAAGS